MKIGVACAAFAATAGCCTIPPHPKQWHAQAGLLASRRMAKRPALSRHDRLRTASYPRRFESAAGQLVAADITLSVDIDSRVLEITNNSADA
jgi:hypothetical protein